MKRAGIMALAVLVLFASLPAASAGDLVNYIWDTRTYEHPYPTDVKPGDLVYGHNPDLFNALIPGYWVHVAIVAWYNESINDWMVIEAKIGKGIIITPLRVFLSRYQTVALQRVKVDDSIREKAVAFAVAGAGSTSTPLLHRRSTTTP
ncbi:MAG: YiiX/YebB-like N1pC/P60 family cysteine hydrolase [Thermococcus sp.]